MSVFANLHGTVFALPSVVAVDEVFHDSDDSISSYFVRHVHLLGVEKPLSLFRRYGNGFPHHDDVENQMTQEYQLFYEQWKGYWETHSKTLLSMQGEVK